MIATRRVWPLWSTGMQHRTRQLTRDSRASRCGSIQRYADPNHYFARTSAPSEKATPPRVTFMCLPREARMRVYQYLKLSPEKLWDNRSIHLSKTCIFDRRCLLDLPAPRRTVINTDRNAMPLRLDYQQRRNPTFQLMFHAAA